MKVFKGDDSNCQPTSPVNGRMLYTSSTNNSSKLAFPGSLFPPESSPTALPQSPKHLGTFCCVCSPESVGCHK
uniref:Uncharacterized protein n=1 Tax=Anguilla anguilla TaxID=7936 RepID=A0A0E9QHG3_ANGAN